MSLSSARHYLFCVPSLDSFRDAAAAIIILDDGRYLMQLRDDKPGIFYPDHWGLFGGAMEPGEDGETALRRELREEIDRDDADMVYFTRMDFGFETLGAKNAVRYYYQVRLKAAALDTLTLGEGQAMKPLTAEQILLEKRVVPYDSFAIWMHCAWIGQSGDTNPLSPTSR